MKYLPHTRSDANCDGEVLIFNPKGKWIAKCRTIKIADEILNLLNGRLS